MTETRFGSIAVSTLVLPGRERPTARIQLGADAPQRPVLWTLEGLDNLAEACLLYTSRCV